MIKQNIYYSFSFFLIFGINTIPENNLSVEQYIQKYNPIAIEEMRKSGIPASITLAQAICESNCGNSSLALKTKNHFKINCKNEWNGMIHVEFAENCDSDGNRMNSCFRKYESVFDSYVDHTKQILDSQKYRVLFNYPYYDYKGWARGLEECAYSDKSGYADLPIKIIENYNLTIYDNPSFLSDPILRPGIAFEKEVISKDLN